MSYVQAAPGAPPLSDRLSLLWLRALLVACAEGPLPAAFGSTLHGALGRALKLTACAFPDPIAQSCAGCHLLSQCPYPRLFEPQHHPRTTASVPPPALLVAPAAGTPRRAAPGATLAIDLGLVGRGTALPLLLVTLGRMARAGLGPARVACAVVRVDALDAAGRPRAPVQIGDELQGRQPEPLPAAAWVARAASMTAETVTLQVVTPLGLQREGVVESGAPAFVDLIRALVRRADALARAYCGESDPFPDPRGWLEAAAQVRLAEARIVPRRQVRRSASTGHVMPLEGFAGTVRYAGPPEALALFLPLLALGEAMGVGRGCSFGHGRYVVDPRSR